MASADPFTLVYVLGAGHCGSTLLTLLLNAHSRVLGLGEVSTLATIRPSIREASRKNKELQTPLWLDVKRCWEASTGLRFSDIDLGHPSSWEALRWPAGRVRRWALNNGELFSCLASRSGAAILVDSSKSQQRLLLLLKAGFRPKVIHLRRDGRAVLHSYRRRGRSFFAGFRRWLGPTLAARILRRRLPETHWLALRYEDLATAPEQALERVCGFLGVDFEPEMLNFRSRASIGIGGNAMRYRASEEIVLDEEWRSALRPLDRLRFMFLGGLVNRFEGY
jgi:Sulfotransferase family